MSHRSHRTLGRLLVLVVLAGALLACHVMPVPSQPGSGGQASSAASSMSAASDTWDPSIAPDYYLVTGKAEIPSDAPTTAGDVSYAPLDSLGRATSVKACVSCKMVQDSAGWREDIDVDPAGWPHPNPKVAITSVSGSHTYHGYMWNRSHMLADSLGGRPIAENLVTGTRMQNVGMNGADGESVGGMAYIESKVRDWFWDRIDAGDTDATCQYCVTAQYQGNELVPRTVTVDALTSDGSIDEHVIVYNAANGYDIDYSNASFSEVSDS